MGGGVMRTAAKTAAFGVYRPALGRAASAVGMRSTVPAPPPSASAAVADSLPISINMEESKGLSESANPAISQWELDDWEFAGWKSEGEDQFEEPPPRLVFSPVPSIEEAQEATTDLTRAIERANEHGKMGNLPSSSAMIPVVPRGVAQALSLLQSSPEAQSVVVSLASDKNVWDAVMKNEKVMEFYRNHQSSFTENIFEDTLSQNEEKSEETNNNSEAGDDAPHGSNGFTEFVNNVKMKAMEFVSNISDFVQDIFGTKTGAHGSETGSTFHSFMNPQNTFLGLAIAVIMVILVKRA